MEQKLIFFLSLQMLLTVPKIFISFLSVKNLMIVKWFMNGCKVDVYIDFTPDRHLNKLCKTRFKSLIAVFLTERSQNH